MKRPLVLLVALLAANGVAACGGNNANEKSASAARESIRKSAEAPSAVNRKAQEHLRWYFKHYLGGGYGQAKVPVYDHIKSITVSRGVATFKTDFPGGARARRRVGRICVAINTSDQDITAARITSSKGKTLRKCLNLG